MQLPITFSVTDRLFRRSIVKLGSIGRDGELFRLAKGVELLIEEP